MSKFAIVVMLPENPADPKQIDFASKEFETVDDIAQALHELEEKQPNWRLIAFCHVEDLPALMSAPPGWT